MSKRSKYRQDYLTRRAGCHWAVRLVYPGRCHFDDCERTERHAHEISLGTSDYAEADIKAMEYRAKHKVMLRAARLRLDTVWQHKLEPGRKHAGADGGEIIATDKELIHIGHDGAIVRTEPNGGPAYELAGGPLTVRSLAEAYPGPRPAAPAKNGDDSILQAYLDHGGKHRTGIKNQHFRREAESVWALFKRLTHNKPLAKCTRDDGRLLIAHFLSEKLEKPTIRKKLMWLVAAVNHAIKDDRFTGANPFSGIAPRDTPEEKRLRKRRSFNDESIKLCKQNLGRLDKPDRLLFRLLASTGMRLSECFEIDREEKREGVRYVNIGRKSELSIRDVPFPADVLPYLPKAGVKGRLFEGTSAAASKRLNRFVRSIGLIDTKLVLHSLRHRVETRLNDLECPSKIQEALLGHEEGKAVGDDYGEISMRKLKQWIDRIGF